MNPLIKTLLLTLGIATSYGSEELQSSHASAAAASGAAEGGSHHMHTVSVPLYGLPSELFSKVAHHLTASDLKQLSLTNKLLSSRTNAVLAPLNEWRSTAIQKLVSSGVRTSDVNYLHHLNITDIKEGELSFIQVAALLLNSYLMPTTADEFRHNSPKEAIMARADFSPREKQMLLHCLPDGNMAERLIVIRDLARLDHADIARTAYRYIVFHSPLARFSYLNSILGLETAYHMTMAENYNLCIKEAAASLEPHITKIEAIQMYQHIKEYNDPIIGDIITQKLHTFLDE